MKYILLTLIALLSFPGRAWCEPLASDTFTNDEGNWKVHWDVTKVDPDAVVDYEPDPIDASNQCLVFSYNTAGSPIQLAAVNTSQIGNITPPNPESVVLRFRAKSNQNDARKVRVWITDSADKSVLAYSSKSLNTDWTDFEFPLAKEKLGGRDKGTALSWPLKMISLQINRETGNEVGEHPEKVWIDDLTLTEE